MIIQGFFPNMQFLNLLEMTHPPGVITRREYRSSTENVRLNPTF